MNNKDSYNNILGIIAITKFATLLFISLLIFNTPYTERDYIDNMQLFIILFVIFLSLSYLLWCLIYLKGNFKESKKLLIFEDILFVFILSFLILSSSTYQSPYKYLFFFSIITTTISQRQETWFDTFLYIVSYYIIHRFDFCF